MRIPSSVDALVGRIEQDVALKELDELIDLRQTLWPMSPEIEEGDDKARGQTP